MHSRNSEQSDDEFQENSQEAPLDQILYFKMLKYIQKDFWKHRKIQMETFDFYQKLIQE